MPYRDSTALVYNVESLGDNRTYSIVAVNNDGISITEANTWSPWPVALITAPIDKKLGGNNPDAYPVPQGRSNIIRALVFDEQELSDSAVKYKIDDKGPWRSMKKAWRIPNSNSFLWEATDWDTSSLSLGEHTISVRAMGASVGIHRITVEVTPEPCSNSLTINISPSKKAGSVSKAPDKNTYCTDEQVTLTATPNTGYSFSSWSGVDPSNGTTATVTMNSSRTVTANFTKQASKPQYEGFLDGANCQNIGGWAWDKSQPDTSINVDIYADNQKIDTVVANQLRQDLNRGNNLHGFIYPTPSSLKDGKTHSINVKFSGTNVKLSNSPQKVPCNGTNVDPLDNWNLRSNVGKDLMAVAYGNGTFVTVGDKFTAVLSADSGTIFTSKDGGKWQTRKSGISDNLFGINWVNGIFIALGWDTISTSSDGVNWTERYRTPAGHGSFPLYSATYGNGTFVVVGETIFTSTDGVNWIERKSAVTDTLMSVIFENGMFVAVGNGKFYTSSDGINWTARVVADHFVDLFIDLTYGDGKFVAVGWGKNNNLIFISSDGINWVPIDLGFPKGKYLSLYGIVHWNGLFVAVGDLEIEGVYTAAIFTSPDGRNWTQRNSGSIAGSFLDIAYGNGSLVAVGGTDATHGIIFQSGSLN